MPEFNFYLDAVRFCTSHNPPISTALIAKKAYSIWVVQGPEDKMQRLTSEEKANLFGASIVPILKKG